MRQIVASVCYQLTSDSCHCAWCCIAGDNSKVAQAVAKAVGIEQYKAGLKPEDKLSYVQQATDQLNQEGDASGEPQGSSHGVSGKFLAVRNHRND